MNTPPRIRVSAVPALAAIALAVAATDLVLVLSPIHPRSPKVDATVSPGMRAAPPAVVYKPHPVGAAIAGRPWITHVSLADLDGSGMLGIIACDAQSNSIRWLRQSPRETFTEQQIGENIAAPAHALAYDFTGDGKLDVLVASMGEIPPNNDPIGSVMILENLGNGRFQQHVVIDHVARVTDVEAGDFDGDGLPDLVVGEFGYHQGEIRWMRNLGGWKFESHVVNVQSGTIHTPVVSLVANERPGFLALISQEFEEIHWFRNAGAGRFADTLIWGSTNEDYGSSGIVVSDVNRDGRPDIVYTNGDGFDYARPGPRPWHGIQWLENRGDGHFAFHRVGDFPGAYSPCAADLNGDGYIDLLAVCGFADWSDEKTVSMMAWLNNGHDHFTPVPLARSPTHLITAAVGDLDGTGRPVIVTGGFHAYPPFDHMSRILIWRRQIP